MSSSADVRLKEMNNDENHFTYFGVSSGRDVSLKNGINDAKRLAIAAAFIVDEMKIYNVFNEDARKLAKELERQELQAAKREASRSMSTAKSSYGGKPQRFETTLQSQAGLLSMTNQFMHHPTHRRSTTTQGSMDLDEPAADQDIHMQEEDPIYDIVKKFPTKVSMSQSDFKRTYGIENGTYPEEVGRNRKLTTIQSPRHTDDNIKVPNHAYDVNLAEMLDLDPKFIRSEHRRLTVAWRNLAQGMDNYPTLARHRGTMSRLDQVLEEKRPPMEVAAEEKQEEDELRAEHISRVKLMYQGLVEYLSYNGRRSGLRAPSKQLQTFFLHTVKLIQHLRDAEQLPLPYQHGFYHCVDNLLATLVFSHCKVHPKVVKEHKREQREAEIEEKNKYVLPKEHMKYFFKLESLLCQTIDKRSRSIMFGFLIVMLTVMAIVGMSWSWANSESNNVREGLQTLVSQYQATSVGNVMYTARQPVLVLQTYTGLITAINKNFTALFQADTSSMCGSSTVSTTLVQSFAESLSLFNIEGITLTTTAGAMFGAYTTGRVATDQAGYVTIQKCSDTDYKQCNVSTSFQQTTCTSWLNDATHSPHANTSYAYETASQAKTQAWTPSVYPLLSPRHSDPTQPRSILTYNSEASSYSAQEVMKQLGVSLAAPISDVNGNIVGVLSVDISTYRFGSLLSGQRRYNNAQMYVTDPSWNILATSIPDMNMVLKGSALGTRGASFTDVNLVSSDTSVRSSVDSLKALHPSSASTKADSSQSDYCTMLPIASAVDEGFITTAECISVGPELQLVVVSFVDEDTYLEGIEFSVYATSGLGSFALIAAVVISMYMVKMGRISETIDQKEATMSRHGSTSRPTKPSKTFAFMGRSMAQLNFEEDPQTTWRQYERQISRDSATGELEHSPTMDRLHDKELEERRKRTIKAKMPELESLARVVNVMLFIVFACMVLIWASWSTKSRSEVDFLSSEIKEQAQEEHFKALKRMFNEPVQVHHQLTAHYNHGYLSDTSSSLNTLNDTYGSYFTGVVQGLWPQSPLLSTYPSSTNISSTIDSVHLGFSSGLYYGARLVQADPSTKVDANVVSDNFFIMAKDGWSGDCLQAYHAVPVNGSQSLSIETFQPALTKGDRNGSCVTYDARTEDWYTRAISATLNPTQGLVWAPVFAVSATDPVRPGGINRRLVTLSRPLVRGGSTVGVLAVDVNLDFMSKYLNHTLYTYGSFASDAFITDESGLLLAMSAQEADEELGDLYIAARSLEPAIVSTSEYLENTMQSGGWRSLFSYVFAEPNHIAIPERNLDDPSTAVLAYKDSYDLQWLATLDIPFEGFQKQFEDRHTRAFLICIATIVLVLFVLVLNFKSFKKKVVRAVKKDKSENVTDRLGDITQVHTKDLESYLTDIRPLVIEACARSYFARQATKKELRQLPLSINDLESHYQDTAVEHIQNAVDGRNILTLCQLQLGRLRTDELREQEREREEEDARRAQEEMQRQLSDNELFESSLDGQNVTVPEADIKAMEDSKAPLVEEKKVEDTKPSLDRALTPQDDPTKEKPRKNSLQIDPDLTRETSRSRNADPNRFGSGFTRLASREEAQELQTNMWPIKIFMLHTSTIYRFIFNAIVIVHISLAFFEPDTYEDLRRTGVAGWVLLIEAGILVVELFDVTIYFLILLRWEAVNRLNEDVTFFARALYGAVVFGVFVDFIITVGFDFSFEYLFPLRPFILVLKNESIRDTVVNFVLTLFKARFVFLLLLFTVMIGAAMGLILFRHVDALNTQGPQSSYANYVRALATTFTYVSTGENYTEVVYPSVEVSPYYLAYWIIFLVVGLFFLLAVVIGLFQYGFASLRDKKLRKATLVKRTGIVAAFILLDLDGSGELSRDELIGFFRNIRPEMSTEDAMEIFAKLNRNDDDQIDVGEFVKGMELLTWKRLIVAKDLSLSRWRVALQLFVFERTWFRNVRMLALLINIFAASLYGVYDNTQLLDVAMGIFLIVYAIEILLRVTAYSWREFWNYAAFHLGKDAEYEMFSNRFDFVIVGVSFVLLIISRAVVGSFTFTENEDSLRFVMTFPLLRIFAVYKKTRDLVFTLFTLLPQFLSIFVVMLVVFFIYAVWGVWMFANRFDLLPASLKPTANFNNLGQSLLALFQLMVGENWHEVMYAAVRTERSFRVSWYFISFILIVTLLFTNVFIGLVLDSFQTMIGSKRHTALAPGQMENMSTQKQQKVHENDSDDEPEMTAEDHLRTEALGILTRARSASNTTRVSVSANVQLNRRFSQKFADQEVERTTSTEIQE